MSTPPDTADIVTEILNFLVDKVVWRTEPPIRIQKETHARIKVTQNSDSLYHTVATVLALNGREGLSRAQLRDKAADFFAYAYSPGGGSVDAVSPEMRRRLDELFPLQGESPLVRGLFSQRPWDGECGGKKAPPPTPYEYGLERAFHEMQLERRRAGMVTLERGSKSGPRMAELLKWYATQAQNPRSFGTLYDLEALAWMLKSSFVVYFDDANKQLRSMGVGPVPAKGDSPYELMWSGDDRCLFCPVVPTAQRGDAQAVADRMEPPYNFTDWKGVDFFRREITRSDFQSAVETFARAGVEPTAARLAERFRTVEERTRPMLEALENDGASGHDLEEEDRRERAVRQVHHTKTQYVAVSVSFKVYDPEIWHRPIDQIIDAYGKKRKGIPGKAERMRVAFIDGRDDPPLDAPFKKYRVEPSDVRNAIVAEGCKRGRRPLAEELAPRLAAIKDSVGIDASAAAVLVDATQGHSREQGEVLLLNSFF